MTLRKRYFIKFDLFTSLFLQTIRLNNPTRYFLNSYIPKKILTYNWKKKKRTISSASKDDVETRWTSWCNYWQSLQQALKIFIIFILINTDLCKGGYIIAFFPELFFKYFMKFRSLLKLTNIHKSLKYLYTYINILVIMLWIRYHDTNNKNIPKTKWSLRFG